MTTAIHRTKTNILEEFLNDPRTTNMAACDKQRQSLHVALVVMRGKVLASATNRNGSRSSGSGYSSHSIHAEKNVIKQLGDISKLRGADLYVMRVSRDIKKCGAERFLYSKPCEQCQIFLEKCMKEYGLKNVYFTA